MSIEVMRLRRNSGPSVAWFALGIAMNALPVTADARIFRDMLSSVGLAKPDAQTNADGTASFPRQGYACCNLHYNKD